ncbi:hypothetical protein MTR05_12670 [Staphylococcus agnetis]|uniref:hypothetical protein n=1 Tax=Staphylococcus agnetis TaxID=985762 RepID=UPI00208F3814|nr:hypothetical protein [Staphylococcus agnetis]MCO4327867.1 hypothetical protein [Staphylococcus agnetis]
MNTNHKTSLTGDHIKKEQLAEDIATKIGILKMRTINDNTQSIIDTYNEMRNEGATLYELELLHEDIMLELKGE